jgi:hypothetical protein
MVKEAMFLALVAIGHNAFAVGWGIFMVVGVGLLVWVVSISIGSVRRLLDHGD